MITVILWMVIIKKGFKMNFNHEEMYLYKISNLFPIGSVHMSKYRSKYFYPIRILDNPEQSTIFVEKIRNRNQNLYNINTLYIPHESIFKMNTPYDWENPNFNHIKRYDWKINCDNYIIEIWSSLTNLQKIIFSSNFNDIAEIKYSNLDII